MSYFNSNLLLIFFSLAYISYQSEENTKVLSLIFNKDAFLTTVDNTENMRILQNNKIYLNTKIATPIQNLKFYLKFSEYITYVTNSTYKKDDSTTYQFTRTKNNGKTSEFTPLNYQTDNLKSGYESKELLKLDENIINNFYFILADKINNKNEIYDSVIGLNLPLNDIRPVLMNTNILEQLKQNNFIDKRVFSIFYFNEISVGKINNKDGEGQIIFGKLPHELNNDKKYSEILKKYNFNEDNLNWINTEAGEYHIKWKLKFDSIVCANEKTSDLITELVIEQTVITGTSEFKNIIQKYFFDEYISKNLCKEEKFYSYRDNLQYYFYSCDISIKSYFDKYNNDILEFKSKDLDNTFSFKIKELFLEFSNRLYFGIIFDEYQMYGWKLGRLFLEKYPLIFSMDNKAIGYYNQNANNTNNNSNKTVIIILIVIVFILLIILCIGLRKYKILKGLMPRKLMANELHDQYSYSHVEDNKKEKEITTEMSSKSNYNSISSLGF